MAQVVLENVSKIYGGDVVAVAPMDLAVADGEFVVLVGPSGCGKSTTLRIVAGLEEASSGTVRIGERIVNDVEPKDRNVAMVFQSYALYPHMSVRDNLAFGLKMRRLSRDTIQQKVEQAARTLGIDQLLDRKPKALSGGQRQRVALGRAIVRDPDVFLFDEPLSNLDAKMRVQMRTEISRLHHTLGATMIYVTHDQVEAMTLGQRIVILNGGQVMQVDTPLSLYERPANRFVAGFIGSPAMNFLGGTLVRDDGLHLALDGPGDAVTLPASFDPPAATVGAPVVLGIRPEHIELTDAEQAACRAQLQVIEPLGNETLLYLALADEQLVVRGPGQVAATIDQTLGLSLAAEHIHLFDPGNGDNLLI